MLKKDPWEGYIAPAAIFGNLYFVGTRPASTHVIDTGAGLMLIDPGYQESLYLVLHNMWKVGLDPEDIKVILLTHAHYDHTDATAALVALTGARVCISEADRPLVKGELFHYPLRPFTPDRWLKDGDEVTLGNTTVQCIATPGHTDGTLSLFFDVSDGERTLRAGMFGGAGLNTLKSQFLRENGLPFDCREKYLQSLARLERERVDIPLGNHVGQNDTEGKLARLRQGERDAFVDAAEWHPYLQKLRDKAIALFDQDI